MGLRLVADRPVNYEIESWIAEQLRHVQIVATDEINLIFPLKSMLLPFQARTACPRHR